MGHEEHLKKIIQGYDFDNREVVVEKLEELVGSIVGDNKSEIVKGLQ